MRSNAAVDPVRPSRVGKKRRSLFSCFWKNTLKQLKQPAGILDTGDAPEHNRLDPAFSPFVNRIADSKGAHSNMGTGVGRGEDAYSIASTPSSTNKSLESGIGTKSGGKLNSQQTTGKKEPENKAQGGLGNQTVDSSSAGTRTSLTMRTNEAEVRGSRPTHAAGQSEQEGDKKDINKRTEAAKRKLASTGLHQTGTSVNQDDYPSLGSLSSHLSKSQNRKLQEEEKGGMREIDDGSKGVQSRAKPQGVWGSAKFSVAQRLRMAAEKERKMGANLPSTTVEQGKDIHEKQESSPRRARIEARGREHTRKLSSKVDAKKSKSLSKRMNPNDTNDRHLRGSVASPPKTAAWSWHKRSWEEPSSQKLRCSKKDDATYSTADRSAQTRQLILAAKENPSSQAGLKSEVDGVIPPREANKAAARGDCQSEKNPQQYESRRTDIKEDFLDFSSDTKRFENCVHKLNAHSLYTGLPSECRSSRKPGLT